MEEFFRDDVGRMEEGWGTIGAVGWVRKAARGRAWPYAQGWGEAAALGFTWTFASTAIAFHSEQLAHNGYSGALSPSGRTWRSQVGPARVPRHNKEASIHLTGGRRSRFCKATSKMKNVRVVEQGVILSKQSVGRFSGSKRFSL